jgi:hypothetical protein
MTHTNDAATATEAGGGGGRATNADETQRVVGGLLAAGGVGLLVLTIASLRESWPHAVEALRPFLALGPVSLAILILFYVINPRSPGDNDPAWIVWVRGVARSFWVLVAAVLVVVGAATFWIATDPEDKPRQFDRFVMQLPGPAPAPSAGPNAAPNPTAPGAASAANAASPAKPEPGVADGAATKPSAGAPAAAAQPGFIMWTVERKGHEAPTGALPTFLGAVLIIAFGLWFPHVRLDETDKALPQLSKFVAPVMSLGLLGVGAGQNMTAEKIKADEKLTQQGLPSYISVPAAQRVATRERILERVYLQDPQKISPESIAELRGKVGDLQEQIEVDIARLERTVADKETAKSLELLNKNLSAIDQTIGNRPVATAMTDAQVQQIAAAIKTTPAVTRIQLNDQEGKCRDVLMRLAAAGESPAVPGTRDGLVSASTSVTPPKPPKPPNALERSWYWFQGKPSPYAVSEATSRKAAEIEALRRQQKAVCPAEAAAPQEIAARSATAKAAVGAGP